MRLLKTKPLALFLLTSVLHTHILLRILQTFARATGVSDRQAHTHTCFCQCISWHQWLLQNIDSLKEAKHIGYWRNCVPLDSIWDDQRQRPNVLCITILAHTSIGPTGLLPLVIYISFPPLDRRKLLSSSRPLQAARTMNSHGKSILLHGTRRKAQQCRQRRALLRYRRKVWTQEQHTVYDLRWSIRRQESKESLPKSLYLIQNK